MRTTIILVAIWFGLPELSLAQKNSFDALGWPSFASFAATNAATDCVSAPKSLPAHHILAEDIVQDSIQLVRFSTNSFAVRWTYTEAGAKKMLAFDEAHEGQKVRTVVGEFESPPGEIMFRPMPPHFATYAEWKEGWLKHRGDKFFGVSESDAKKIVAGLKSK